MADSCPNYPDVPSHKPLAYPLEFGLLHQFGHPSMDDRPNYESSESRGMRAVAPKSERQIVTLN
jgi:hypothetical protein